MRSIPEEACCGGAHAQSAGLRCEQEANESGAPTAAGNSLISLNDTGLDLTRLTSLSARVSKRTFLGVD